MSLFCLSLQLDHGTRGSTFFHKQPLDMYTTCGCIFIYTVKCCVIRWMTLTRISSFLKHYPHSLIPPLQAWNAMCRRSGSGSQQRDLWSRCGLQCQDWRYGQIKTSRSLIWSHRLQTLVSSRFSFLTARIAEILCSAAPVLFSVHFPGTACHWIFLSITTVEMWIARVLQV